MGTTVFCDLITGVQPITFAMFYLLEENPLTWLTRKWRRSFLPLSPNLFSCVPSPNPSCLLRIHPATPGSHRTWSLIGYYCQISRASPSWYSLVPPSLSGDLEIRAVLSPAAERGKVVWCHCDCSMSWLLFWKKWGNWHQGRQLKGHLHVSGRCWNEISLFHKDQRWEKWRMFIVRGIDYGELCILTVYYHYW